jgi:hypothetical protein
MASLGAAPAQAAVSAAGGYDSVAPARLLDTRSGIGAPKAAVGASGTVRLQVARQGGVAANVAAVALNVTVTGATAGGYVTAWADASARPGTSNLNFGAGQTVPNMVIIPVGRNGMIDLYNGSGGTVQLIADVMGYYLPGTATAPGTLTPLAPARLLDTRTGTGAAKAAVAGQHSVTLTVTGHGGVPAGAAAVVLNVTATAPTAAGYVTVWGDGGTRPATSNLNFLKGQTVPNLVIAPVGADGKVDLFNGSGGTLALIADVSGYFAAGTATAPGALHSLAPARLLDTRNGTGAPAAAIAGHGTLALQVTGHGAVPATAIAAAVLNVTVTAPTAAGYVTVFADGSGQPPTSNVNFSKSQTIANLVIAPVGADGKIDFYNGSTGSVQVVADVSGYILGSPQASWVATQAGGPAPVPANQAAFLRSVSCPVAGGCVAVGQYNSTNGARALVAAQSNSTWTDTSPPLPTNAGAIADAGLTSVACTSATSCVAVGYLQDGNGDTQGLIETFAGTTWTSAVAPVAAGATTAPGAELTAVRCTGSGACVAVGNYTDASGHFQPLIDTLSGGTWAVTRAPLPADAGTDPEVALAVLDCPTAGSCVAAGGYRDAGGIDQGFVETESGGTWTALKAPAPADASTAPETTFNSISCPVAGSCELVGQYNSASGGLPLIETVAGGTTVTSMRAPLPRGADADAGQFAQLQSLACTGPGACVAVGSYLAAGDATSVIDTLAGATWTAQQAPVPAGPAQAQTQLLAIACPATQSCIAVGTDATETTAHALIDTLGGGAWSALAAPLPANVTSTPDAALQAVACATTTSCAAVGYDFLTTNSTYAGLIETLIGG